MTGYFLQTANNRKICRFKIFIRLVDAYQWLIVITRHRCVLRLPLTNKGDASSENGSATTRTSESNPVVSSFICLTESGDAIIVLVNVRSACNVRSWLVLGEDKEFKQRHVFARDICFWFYMQAFGGRKLFCYSPAFARLISCSEEL
jgi:hypothetical protein